MTIKKLFIAFVFIHLYTFCFGQKVISLTKQNGVYTVPCSVNGLKRSLVFDTGASTVTISMQLAQLLYNHGKLRDADIKGYGKSQTASGHIVDNTAIILKDIEMGGLHLKNIDAVIIEGQNVPLLLGLSAIQKLGKVTLAGDKLIIESPIMDTPQQNEMRLRIGSYIEKEQFADAIVLLNQLEAQDVLEETDLFCLAKCYCYSEDYNKALIYGQQWMGMYKDVNPSHEPDICYFIALAYGGLKSYYEADKWFSKAIELVSVEPIEQTNTEDALTLSYYYNQKGYNYLNGKSYANCIEAFDIAAQYRMKFLGVTAEDLCAGKVQDERVGNWLYSICKLYIIYLYDNKSAVRYAVLAAMCGNKEAMDFCDYFHYDYSPINK